VTSEDIQTVATLADMLRAKGVRSFEGLGLRLELEPTQERVIEAALPAKPPVAQGDDETCKCGHPHYAHQGGLCIHGCDVEKCVPEEVP